MKSGKNKFEDVGVVILSGGKSTRMSYPKCFLGIKENLLLEMTHAVYASFTDSISVVLNAELSRGQWQVIFRDLSQRMNFRLNEFPDRGRGFSIRLGLRTVALKEYCFMQNVDNPVSRNTILSIVSEKYSEGYTVPVMNGRSGHPILLSRSVMDRILSLESDNFVLHDILRQYPRKEVQVNDPGIFTNLNTAEDVRQYTSTIAK